MIRKATPPTPKQAKQPVVKHASKDSSSSLAVAPKPVEMLPNWAKPRRLGYGVR
jgi:hypothetical protein